MVVQFILPHYASPAVASARFALFLPLRRRVLHSPSPVLGKPHTWRLQCLTAAIVISSADASPVFTWLH